MMTEQEILNNQIAEELNKWQPILEYGRIFLDEERALEKKYTWLIWIKKGLPWGIIVTIIEGVVSNICSLSILYILLGIFILLIILSICIIYQHRNEISKFLNKKDKSELNILINETNKYISDLSGWISELDYKLEVPASKVSTIYKEFIEAKTVQLPNENKFSKIHGNLEISWVKRANDFAGKRLQPLKQYIYE